MAYECLRNTYEHKEGGFSPTTAVETTEGHAVHHAPPPPSPPDQFSMLDFPRSIIGHSIRYQTSQVFFNLDKGCPNNNAFGFGHSYLSLRCTHISGFEISSGYHA